MASSRRMFVKVYDDLEDHPRWQEVDRLPECVGLWTLALSYCHRNHTDGHFPERLATRRWGGSVDAVDELLDRGRWHERGHECEACPQPAEGALYLHDYLDHQRSKEQVEELSKTRAKIGAKGGKARAQQLAKQTGAKPVADTDTDTDKRTTAADAAEFDLFWTTYPRKAGKAAAAKAHAKAVKATGDPQVILSGLAAAVRHWEAERTEARFIPHPATWLNQGRWDDDTSGHLDVKPTPGKSRALAQCDDSHPHPRHTWEDPRNIYLCQGV